MSHRRRSIVMLRREGKGWLEAQVGGDGNNSDAPFNVKVGGQEQGKSNPCSLQDKTGSGIEQIMEWSQHEGAGPTPLTLNIFSFQIRIQFFFKYSN